MKKIIILFFFTFSLTILFSQTPTIVMPKHNNTPGFEITYNLCDANFYDSGGLTGDYEFGENGIITFCPTIGTDRIVIDFSFLDLQAYHYLTIYDGDSDSAPILEIFTNILNDNTGYTVAASQSNTTGCLTVTFSSGNATYTQIYDGWEANISCTGPCQSIITYINTSPQANNDNILRVCTNETVTFNGSATFSDDDTNATYKWDFGDGTGTFEGTTVNHSFENPGIYNVNFIASDTVGCNDSTNPELIVYVSAEPDFTGTTIMNNPICLGETTELIGVVNPQTGVPNALNIQSQQWQPDSSIISSTGNTILVQPQNYGQNCYIYEAIDINGCIFTKTVCVIVSDEITAINPDDIIICDSGELSIPIDLTSNESQMLNGLNPNNYTILYYMDQNLNIPISNPSNYTYNFNTETIYVTIQHNATTCIKTFDFEVNAENMAPTSYEVYIDSDLFAASNTIIATASGQYEYLFSLDNGEFISSGIFNNVSSGPHFVTISESSDCGKVIVPIFIVGYPKFFTPNNDGYNDTWNITGAFMLQNIRITIFNRFGKVLKLLDQNSIGWDGTYNGSHLPSSDYWFKIEYDYQGVSNKTTGHFTLKR